MRNVPEIQRHFNDLADLPLFGWTAVNDQRCRLPLAARRLQQRFALPANTALTVAACAGFRMEG